jgi:hypothetical protein
MSQRSNHPPNYFQSNLGNKVKEIESKINETDQFELFCASMVKEIDEDESLGQFKSEYLKILHVIKKSRNNCQLLLGKSADVAEVRSQA